MSSKWTIEDITLMNEMIANKQSFNKIAKVLKRSPFAIKYKFGRQYRKRKFIKSTKSVSKCSGSGSDSSTDMKTTSINATYSPPISVCTLLSFVVVGGISIIIFGTGVFITTLFDSLQKIKPT